MNNCPFLGKEEDPQNHLDFSSDQNYCYRTEKPTRILLETQQIYCLKKDYPGCPVYQDVSHLTLPLEIHPDGWVEPKRANSQVIWAVIAVFLLSGVIGVSWLFKPVAFVPQPPVLTLTVNNYPAPLAETTLTDFVRPTVTPTLAVIKTFSSPTLLPTESRTAPPVLSEPLGLETPIKSTPQLIIHRIAQGDSLALLASRFGTSVAAIRSVNYFLPVPLWDGVLVVIPVNTMDVSDLPAFEPYQVKERSIPLIDIAFNLNTTPELLGRYNSMDPNAILIKDSWLVIPRPFPPPTGLPLATQDGKLQNYNE